MGWSYSSITGKKVNRVRVSGPRGRGKGQRWFSPGRQRALSLKWASWTSARLGSSSTVSARTTSACPAWSMDSTALKGRSRRVKEPSALSGRPLLLLFKPPSPDVLLVRVTRCVEATTAEKITAPRVMPAQALRISESRIIVGKTRPRPAFAGSPSLHRRAPTSRTPPRHTHSPDPHTDRPSALMEVAERSPDLAVQSPVRDPEVTGEAVKFRVRSCLGLVTSL